MVQMDIDGKVTPYVQGETYRMIRTGSDGVERYWATFDHYWASRNGMTGVSDDGAKWRLESMK